MNNVIGKLYSSGDHKISKCVSWRCIALLLGIDVHFLLYL